MLIGAKWLDVIRHLGIGLNNLHRPLDHNLPMTVGADPLLAADLERATTNALAAVFRIVSLLFHVFVFGRDCA
jgi:hypothetical protein